MKFKDLPEGCYRIHAVGNTVSLERTEVAPDWPIEADVFLTQVVHDGRAYRKYGHILNEKEVEFRTNEEIKKERKQYAAKLSHVTRALNEKKPMTGKVLETALSLVTCDDPSAGINKDPFFQNIAKKMVAGEPLSDYEYHMVVDVHMVHSKF